MYLPQKRLKTAILRLSNPTKTITTFDSCNSAMQLIVSNHIDTPSEKNTILVIMI